MRNKRTFCKATMILSTESTLQERRQHSKYYSQVFIGPHCSKMLFYGLGTVTDAKELVDSAKNKKYGRRVF